jgi:hypothetical protein
MLDVMTARDGVCGFWQDTSAFCDNDIFTLHLDCALCQRWIGVHILHQKVVMLASPWRLPSHGRHVFI